MQFLIQACRLGGLLLFLCLSATVAGQSEVALQTVKEYGWSEGWTNVRFFRSGGKDYVFLGKESGAANSGKNAHIHPLNADGTLGKRVYEKKWSEGWTSVEFYTINGQTYMIRLKELGNGDKGDNVHIERMNADGTVGTRVISYGWSEGWTTVRPYQVGGKHYLFLLKERGAGRSGKNAHIHPLNNDGSIGKRIYERKWSEGWTLAEFYTVNNQVFFIRIKTRGYDDSGNNVHIDRVNADGTIGRRVQSYRWSEGWTNIRFCQIRGKTYMAFQRTTGQISGGRNFLLHRMSPAGTLDPVIIGTNIGEGWTSLELYDVRGQQFLFQLKERGNNQRGNNVEIKRLL